MKSIPISLQNYMLHATELAKAASRAGGYAEWDFQYARLRLSAVKSFPSFRTLQDADFVHVLSILTNLSQKALYFYDDSLAVQLDRLDLLVNDSLYKWSSEQYQYWLTANNLDLPEFDANFRPNLDLFNAKFYSKFSQKVNQFVPLLLKKPERQLFSLNQQKLKPFDVCKKSGGELTIDRTLSSELYKSKMAKSDSKVVQEVKESVLERKLIHFKMLLKSYLGRNRIPWADLSDKFSKLGYGQMDMKIDQMPLKREAGFLEVNWLSSEFLQFVGM